MIKVEVQKRVIIEGPDVQALSNICEAMRVRFTELFNGIKTDVSSNRPADALRMERMEKVATVFGWTLEEYMSANSFITTTLEI